MMRNTALSSFLLLVIFSFVPRAQSQSSHGQAGGPPPQLTVSKVTVNGFDTTHPTLAIEGYNFGNAPEVYIGASGGGWNELTVLSASQNFINAQLTAPTPGTYVVVVSRGPSTTDKFWIDVTIGAAGATGQTNGRSPHAGSPITFGSPTPAPSTTVTCGSKRNPGSP